MTYSICCICNYVGDICDVYVVLVRVDNHLVVISHFAHTICIFSFPYIARGIYIWFRANIFKIFFLKVNKCYLYTEINWCLQLHLKPWLELGSMIIWRLPYSLVYKSTFYDQKINLKNHPRLIHESYLHLTQAIQEISITIAWSLLGNQSNKTSSNCVWVS